MRREIQDKINAAKQELQALAVKKAELDARVAALEEVLVVMADEQPKPRVRTRTRPLTAEWKKILFLMDEEEPQGASYDDLARFAERVGLDQSKATIRSYVSHYKTSGYLDSPATGTFVVTSKGRDRFVERIDELRSELCQEVEVQTFERPKNLRWKAPRHDPEDEIPF